LRAQGVLFLKECFTVHVTPKRLQPKLELSSVEDGSVSAGQ